PNAPPTTAIYTLSLHDALPIYPQVQLQAAMGLAEFGADAEPALGDLVAVLQSKQDDAQLREDLYLNAAITIGKIGKPAVPALREDRKSTRLNSSHVSISYAVFC